MVLDKKIKYIVILRKILYRVLMILLSYFKTRCVKHVVFSCRKYLIKVCSIRELRRFVHPYFLNEIHPINFKVMFLI